MSDRDDAGHARERVHEIRNSLHAIAMRSAVIRAGLSDRDLTTGAEAEAVEFILSLCARCSDQLDDVAQCVDRLAEANDSIR